VALRIGTTDIADHARVLWLAVSATNTLIAFRNALIATASTHGLDLSYLRPTFWPHITLGSGGPTHGKDWSTFDIHDVPKLPYLGPTQVPVHAAALQLTNSVNAPLPLVLIRKYADV
jgi:hypothetical protein